ncbi:ATP-dependent DNA helicase DDX11 isoform X1 [Achroia grisella]|uniref:ATP-dependent DNA helicase DDX11 isoform X1 n=1 Tax=Achroia grisella TaxID=688607 RepID=UPI0027D2B734|nr:ATP-dependent DNA helicase DDX11 isoform X1 [Achroia grisella]
MNENMDPTFSFPFKPYPIQENFMKQLYFTIENNKLGIFESPTGTGKSLSICCGAIQWLKDNEHRNLEELEKNVEILKLELNRSASSFDWLEEEYEKIKKNHELIALQAKVHKIKERIEKFNEMKIRVTKLNFNVNKNVEFYNNRTDKNKNDFVKENNQEVKKTEEDDDLILEECEVQEYDEEHDSGDDNIENKEDILKIFIGSRTHSQLSQFVGEIKRTVFKDDTRVVTLASRQHYCINAEVAKLKNINLINERCLDLQKSRTKSTAVDSDGRATKKSKTKSCSACPYYNQNNISKLKEKILVDIMDMEDLVKCGKELKACPYYASRAAMDDAEVVLMSHAGVASAGARTGMSLNLNNNILILDEAHGLPTALENANSAPLSERDLSSVKTCLQYYVNKYSSRLSSRNLLLLNQMSFIVGKLLGLIRSTNLNKERQEKSIYMLEDFVVKAEIDHMNFRPIVEFCRKSRLAPKLHSFSMRYSQEALEEEIEKANSNKKSSFKSFLQNIKKDKDIKRNSKQKLEESVANRDDIKEGKDTKSDVQNSQRNTSLETSAGTGLYRIMEFLELLCDRSENGRVLAQTGHLQSGQLKYLLLNPIEHFAEVTKQCRSVVLAGGTMEPVSEFLQLLTGSSNQSEKVNVVKCEHVVPKDNVLGICVTKGPSQLNLNFGYENRMSKNLLAEVGHILRNICNLVPGGVVCFLPSYTYEETVYDNLKTTGVLESISRKKTVFREPKSATDVDQVLSKYAKAVQNKQGDFTGALLLSVVGGKLSEGLNFSDDLGRCVIVVGMPYPNIKSPELKEKMKYLDRMIGPNAGHTYYENLCMKAVNQCIGRAVRHINDFACILLLDERYSRPTTISALPSFVQRSLITDSAFGNTIGSVARFFTRQKQKNINESGNKCNK